MFLVKCKFNVSNFDLSGTSRRCLRRSFRPPFSKGGADPTRGALVASAEAKLLFAAFLFCQAFFFGPSVSKKKAGNRFKKCLRAKGNSLRLGEVHPLAQRLRGTHFANAKSPPPLSTKTKGNPPLVWFLASQAKHTHRKRSSPLPSRGSAFTLLWRFGRIRKFRPLRRATADRGGSDELLKKLEQNFQ